MDRTRYLLHAVRKIKVAIATFKGQRVGLRAPKYESTKNEARQLDGFRSIARL